MEPCALPPSRDFDLVSYFKTNASLSSSMLLRHLNESTVLLQNCPCLEWAKARIGDDILNSA